MGATWINTVYRLLVPRKWFVVGQRRWQPLCVGPPPPDGSPWVSFACTASVHTIRIVSTAHLILCATYLCLVRGRLWYLIIRPMLVVTTVTSTFGKPDKVRILVHAAREITANFWIKIQTAHQVILVQSRPAVDYRRASAQYRAPLARRANT